MVLEIAGLSLPTEQTSAGLLLANTNPYLEPLVWFINIAVTENMIEWQQQLDNHEDIRTQALSAIYAPPDRDLTSGKARWSALTGNELGKDVYVIHTSFSEDSTYIPRPALLEILNRMFELRRSDSPLEPEVVHSTNVSSAFDALENEPSAHNVLEVEAREAILRELENQAVTLEELTKQLPSQGLGAVESVKRRALLIELDAAGFFDPAQMDEIHRQLQQWQLSTLMSYLVAAQQLLNYYISPERQQILPDTEITTIMSGSISIDWFRNPKHTPVEYTPFEWLSWCENVFHRAELSPTAGAGEIFTHIQDKITLLIWRRDDSIRPKLLRATLMEN